MHLHPTTPVASDPSPSTAPVQHGRSGSDARLAVLHYLANRPVGARCTAIASAIGMTDDATQHVLNALRRDSRVAPDKRFAHVLWYVPAARANLSASQLDAMLEQALAGAQ